MKRETNNCRIEFIEEKPKFGPEIKSKNRDLQFKNQKTEKNIHHVMILHRRGCGITGFAVNIAKIEKKTNICTRHTSVCFT